MDYPEGYTPPEADREVAANVFLIGMMCAAATLRVGFGTAALEMPVEALEYAAGKRGEDTWIGFCAWCQPDNADGLECSFTLKEDVGLAISAEEVVRRYVGLRGHGHHARMQQLAFKSAHTFTRLLSRTYSMCDTDTTYTAEHTVSVVDEKGHIYSKTDLRDGSGSSMSQDATCVSDREEQLFDEIVGRHETDRINGLLVVLGLPPCEFSAL